LDVFDVYFALSAFAGLGGWRLGCLGQLVPLLYLFAAPLQLHLFVLELKLLVLELYPD
jgi:hypothetical protein